MTAPTGTTRKLNFPLNLTDDMESVVGADSIPAVTLEDWSESDSDVRIDIVLNLSLNEYLALANSIDVGRDIAYGDNSIYIWWVWVRSIVSMDICQSVLDCINETKAIQQAIARYSLGSSIEITTPEQQIILDTDFFGGQGDCDNDHIYGMTIQLTDFLNVLSEDLLQIFVTAMSTPGRLGDIIEAIPVIGELPFDDILQFAEKMADQVESAYLGAYDIQIREDISCALFCIAVDNNCVLTLEDARDYFRAKIITAVTDLNFFTIVSEIVLNNWIGEQAIYMIHWMILDAIIFGGEILGIDVNRVATTISSYFNDPDSDWSTLCTNCGWTVELISNSDFTGLTAVAWGFGSLSTCLATFTGNKMIGCGNASDPFQNWAAKFSFTVTDQTVITDITIEYEWHSTRTAYLCIGDIGNEGQADGNIARKITNTQTGTNFTQASGLSETDGTLVCSIGTRGDFGDPSTFLNFTKFTISGTGDNPFT